MSLSALLKFRKPERLSLEDYFKKLKSKGLNKDGTPILDPTPIAPPIGYKKQPSMVEIVRDMVRGERLAQEAAARGQETFEEAEDFDVGDDPELLRSPYENEFDPPLSELTKAGEQSLAEKKKAQQLAAGAHPSAVGGAGGTPPAEGSEIEPVPPKKGP